MNDERALDRLGVLGGVEHGDDHPVEDPRTAEDIRRRASEHGAELGVPLEQYLVEARGDVRRAYESEGEAFTEERSIEEHDVQNSTSRTVVDHREKRPREGLERVRARSTRVLANL